MNRQQTFWEKQKNGQWKILTNSLKNDPEINSHLNNFITIFYWKFREKKGINRNIHPRVNFQGFKGYEDFSEPTKMGHCEAPDLHEYWQESNGKKVEDSEYWTGTISIVLSQKLLLARLGMNEWYSGERSYLSVGFDELIGTIAHELAHAFQFISNLKREGEISQCESSGKRDTNGNLLYPELVAEHTQLTEEIKGMIESSKEYQNFKEWWNIKQEARPQVNDKKKKLIRDPLYKCRECKGDICERDRMYRDYDDNKYCEECGEKRIKENWEAKLKTCDGCEQKVVATELFLGNHRWGSDDIGKNLCGSCWRKAESKQKNKVQEAKLNMDRYKNASCSGGCGRRIQKGAICSYEDCVRQRGYHYLDEPNLKLIQCSKCGVLHRQEKEGNSFFKHCAKCQKRTDCNRVDLKTDSSGEYQIIDPFAHNHKEKSINSSPIGWIVGGIILLVLAIVGFFWLVKRKVERKND